MYCWSCGHKNPDENKFCAECGKKQMRPPVLVEEETGSDVRTASRSTNVREDEPRIIVPPTIVPASVKSEAKTAESPTRVEANVGRTNRPEVKAVETKADKPESLTIPPPPPGTGITPPTRTASTNPLIGEPRAIRDTPLAAAVETPPSGSAPRTTSSGPARISGPSFLGLSDGPASSDYLFEEEAPERSSTARSYIFLALILAAGVLIYKNWGSVSALGSELTQRAAAPAPSTMQPSSTSTQPSTPATTEVAVNKPEQKPESDADASDANAAKDSDASESAAAAESTEEDAVKKETSPPEPKAERQKTEKASASKADKVAAAPVYDESAVDQAQKYLQGRGVAQDCTRGVSLLRSAAAQPNPKAQIKLGALYATGHCVEQDRAEAYRWFAQAHELQPGNQWIDKNLNTLWSEMTSEERARAQR